VNGPDALNSLFSLLFKPSSTLVIEEISDLFINIFPIALVTTRISLPSSEIIFPINSTPSFFTIKTRFSFLFSIS